jgi:hypothetical protein
VTPATPHKHIGFFKKLLHDVTKVGPLAFVPGVGAGAMLALGTGAGVGHIHTPIVRDVARAADKLAKNPIVHAVTQGYTSLMKQTNPAYFASTLVAGAGDEALHGVPLGKAILDQRHAVTKWIADKARYASQIAGVPPQATQALTAAANLAEGKPIAQNIMAVASGVLGQTVGPAAQQALQQGAAIGHKIAREGFTPAAISQIVTAKQKLGPAEAHALDTGTALTVAQHLQSKGYAAAHALMPPVSGGPAGKVIAALHAPTSDLLSTAMTNVKQSLPPNPAAQVRRVATELVRHPELAHLPSHELAHRFRVHEPIARVALASFSHEVPGAPIFHHHRLEAIGPNSIGPWTAYYAAQAPQDVSQPSGPPPPASPAPTTTASYGPYPQVT